MGTLAANSEYARDVKMHATPQKRKDKEIEAPACCKEKEREMSC